MKTRLFLLITTFSFLFSSCGILDELDDVTFGAEFSKSFNVSKSGDGEGAAYDEQVTITVTDDPDVSEYSDKLQEIKLKKLYYRIVAFSGVPDASLTGELKVGNSTSTSANAQVAKSVTINSLSDALASGEKVEVPVTQADIDQVSGWLINDKSIKIFMVGTLSTTPVNITVELIVETDVTAEAL